jgi:hypothetical protein
VKHMCMNFKLKRDNNFYFFRYFIVVLFYEMDYLHVKSWNYYNKFQVSSKVQATPIFKLKNFYMLAMENIKTLFKCSLHMGRIWRCTRISWVVHGCKTCRWIHPIYFICFKNETRSHLLYLPFIVLCNDK